MRDIIIDQINEEVQNGCTRANSPQKLALYLSIKKHLLERIDSNPILKSDYMYALAYFYEHVEENYDAAIKTYLKCKPQSKCCKGIGNCYIKLGDYDKAKYWLNLFSP